MSSDPANVGFAKITYEAPNEARSPLLFSGTGSVVIDSNSASQTRNDLVTIHDVSLRAATSLKSHRVKTGGDDHTLRILRTSLGLTQPGKGIKFDAGDGTDALIIERDADWTARDSALSYEALSMPISGVEAMSISG